MENVADYKEIVDVIKDSGGEAFKLCYQCGLCDVVCPSLDWMAFEVFRQHTRWYSARTGHAPRRSLRTARAARRLAAMATLEWTCHGGRSRVQLLLKLAGTENTPILAVNTLAVNGTVHSVYSVNVDSIALGAEKSVLYHSSVQCQKVAGASSPRFSRSVRSWRSRSRASARRRASSRLLGRACRRARPAPPIRGEA